MKRKLERNKVFYIAHEYIKNAIHNNNDLNQLIVYNKMSRLWSTTMILGWLCYIAGLIIYLNTDTSNTISILKIISYQLNGLAAGLFLASVIISLTRIKLKY